MWTVPTPPLGVDMAEDPLEEGQQPHKDHLMGTPTEPASNVASRDTLPETAP